MIVNLHGQIGLGALMEARAWGSEGDHLGQLNGAEGIVVTRTGAVWVADRNNHRLCLLH